MYKEILSLKTERSNKANKTIDLKSKKNEKKDYFMFYLEARLVRACKEQCRIRTSLADNSITKGCQKDRGNKTELRV